MNKILSPLVLSICLAGAGYEQSAQARFNPLQLLRSAAHWIKGATVSGGKEVGKLLIAQGILTGIQMLYAKGIAGAFGRATESAALQKNDPAPCQPDEGLIAPETVPAEINTRLIQLINHPERLQAVGARMWRGILLTGLPGTGKTQLGYYLARATNSRVLYEGATGLIDAAQGSGSRSVRQLFVRAQHRSLRDRIKGAFLKVLAFLHLRRAQPPKPTIVIVDEIDSIGRPRGGAIAGLDRARAQERERTLEQLLTELDGAHQQSVIPDVFIVATSNRPAHELDAALVRPGRLKVIEVPPLTNEHRQAILQFHANRLTMPLAPDVNFREFVEQVAPNASGDYLAHAVNDAALAVASEEHPQLTQEGLIRAFRAYRPAREQRPVAIDATAL